MNRSAVTNTAGRTADYVELRNTNIASFDLAGYRLSTDPQNASQWTFPAGSSIPGLGHLVVWFDAGLPPTTLAGDCPSTAALAAAFRVEVARRQRRSDGTVSECGHVI